MKTKTRQQQKHPGGRPPKFAEPRRPITVTLPDRILAMLDRIGPDRARAIVKSVDAVLGLSGGADHGLQLVEVAPGTALIVVPPSRQLRKVPWLRLAEVAPARFVLWMPTGTSVDSLEVALTDLLDDLPAADDNERGLRMRLRELLRRVRRDGRITKGEIMLVDTGSGR
jgi:hypothetical protein